jgi:hypothetical protein
LTNAKAEVIQQTVAGIPTHCTGFEAVSAFAREMPDKFILNTVGTSGGDFLPGFKRFEVEIARLSLESTTWDVISIRARPSSRGIVYRAVDEYGTDYHIRPRSSRKPLTLGKLIQLIESMTGWEDDRSMSPSALRDSQGFCNDEGRISELRSFVTVSSEFYPDLEPWYERDADRWVERKLADLP